jgi:hypothetical protein
MNFSDALNSLKSGSKISREGWNGKDMFLYLVKGSKFIVNSPPLNTIYPEGTEVEYRSYIDIRTAQGDLVPWVASQSDLLAEDWLATPN